jgi:hypothetical protein
LYYYLRRFKKQSRDKEKEENRHDKMRQSRLYMPTHLQEEEEEALPCCCITAVKGGRDGRVKS